MCISFPLIKHMIKYKDYVINSAPGSLRCHPFEYLDMAGKRTTTIVCIYNTGSIWLNLNCTECKSCTTTAFGEVFCARFPNHPTF